MESSPYTLSKATDELLNKIESLNSVEQNKFDNLKVFVKKIKENEKKTNLIFFGSMCSGKTTSINLILRYLLEKKNIQNDISLNETTNDNLGCPSQNSINYEFLRLPSAATENTYFFWFIEKTECQSGKYQLSLKLEDFEKKIFEENKIFNSKIKKIGTNFEINEEFENTQDGIKRINKFIVNIDRLSSCLLEEARKNEFNEKNVKKEEKSIPIIKIKIPNFTKKYRLIDTPGLSLKKFSEDLKANSLKELNFFNIFIFVNEISCKTTYSLEYEILNKVDEDYGKPIIYSLYTKGLRLMEDLERTEVRNPRQAKIDRSKYLENNNKFYGRLKSLEKDGILIRKIIPIVDDLFENENVKRNIKYFMDDVKAIIEKYQKTISYKTGTIRLRQEIMRINDQFSNDKLFTEEEIKILKQNKFDINNEREEKLRKYFGELNSFKDYKSLYPDHLHLLKEKYKENDRFNPHNFSRSNYIERHMRDAFRFFQTTILKKADEINAFYLEKFVNSINEEIRKKIIHRLQQEGIIDETSNKFDGIFSIFAILSGTTILGTISVHLVRAGIIAVGESIAVAAGISWVPVVGWTIGVLTLVGGIIYGISDKIGIWSKANATEDISKGLFKWFLTNKGDLLKRYIDSFIKLTDKFINELGDKKNLTDELCSNLLKIMDRIEPFPIEKTHFQLDKDDLLNITHDQKLKQFTKEMIEYQPKDEDEEEQDDDN